jgi:hypothetical protein
VQPQAMSPAAIASHAACRMALIIIILLYSPGRLHPARDTSPIATG